MESDSVKEKPRIHRLNIRAIVGFDGSTVSGLKVHPDNEHIVYPLGNFVTIQNLKTKNQWFLVGHTNIVSAMDLSKSGKYIASGQINHIGFKAMVIIWDYATKQMISKYESHKVRVEYLKFSSDDNFLMSIGGRDCGTLIVWNVQLHMCVVATETTYGVQGDAYTILPMNKRGVCFMTAGDYNCALWKIDMEGRNAYRQNITLLKLRRVILCMVISERDEIAYCGTSTGDIIKLRMHFHHDHEIIENVKPPGMVGCYSKYIAGRKKRIAMQGFADLWEMGVKALYLFKNGQLVVGAGNGDVDLVEELPKSVDCCKKETKVLRELSTPSLKVLRSVNVKSCVTSIAAMKGKTLLVGTAASEIYSINGKTFEMELLVTCHTSAIFDIAFPHNFSEVFATSCATDVRIWSVSKVKELVRIIVPNFNCSSLVFTHDGKALVTAWNDGIIRAFTPCTGRLIYSILNAHNKGVSALAITDDGTKLVSGGCEGQVRVWKICKLKQMLLETLKEHHAPITKIDINKANTEAVSSSTDGSCIIWDIVRMCRKQILFSNTLFMAVKYHTSDVQLLTVGTNRKIAWWEVYDGSLVREVDGSHSSALNALDVSPTGQFFVTGASDQIVKMWFYTEGTVVAYGIGHAAPITGCRFSPDSKMIVTVSAAGSIFIWDCPSEQETQIAAQVVEEPQQPPEELLIMIMKEPGCGCGTKRICPCGCGRPIPIGIANCSQLPPC